MLPNGSYEWIWVDSCSYPWGNSSARVIKAFEGVKDVIDVGIKYTAESSLFTNCEEVL